jgi:hypothetical protein
MHIVDRKFRLARHWSNIELRRIAPLFSGSVVNVSAGDDVDKEGGHYENYFSKANTYHLTNYSPGSFRGYRGRDNELLLNLTDEIPGRFRRRFDVAFNHTTLEHIFNVQTAFQNLCELSKDIVIVVVPFSQIQHENDGYQDYWRFTPTCLRQLYQQNGLSVIYEAVSPFKDCAIYLFFIGARHPDLWRQRMPSWQAVKDVGSWIGEERRLSISQFLLRLRRSA